MAALFATALFTVIHIHVCRWLRFHEKVIFPAVIPPYAVFRTGREISMRNVVGCTDAFLPRQTP
jgi:hypothetical protein